MFWYTDNSKKTGFFDIMEAIHNNTLEPCGKWDTNRVILSLFLMDVPEEKVKAAYEGLKEVTDYTPEFQYMELDNDDNAYPSNILYYKESFPVEVKLNARPLIPGAKARIDIESDNFMGIVQAQLDKLIDSRKYRYAAQSELFPQIASNLKEVDMTDQAVQTSLGFRPSTEIEDELFPSCIPEAFYFTADPNGVCMY